jgi:hypothetical protein
MVYGARLNARVKFERWVKVVQGDFGHLAQVLGKAPRDLVKLQQSSNGQSLSLGFARQQRLSLTLCQKPLFLKFQGCPVYLHDDPLWLNNQEDISRMNKIWRFF